MPQEKDIASDCTFLSPQPSVMLPRQPHSPL